MWKIMGGGVVLVLLLATASWAAGSIVQIDGGSRITPLADITVTGTATLIKAVTTSRVSLNCTNTSGAVNIRWGSSAVTAAIGQRIGFGSSVAINNIGAVYMISEGANVTVSCTEEEQ